MMINYARNDQNHSSGLIIKRIVMLMLSTSCAFLTLNSHISVAQPIIVNPDQYPYIADQSGKDGTNGLDGTVGNPGADGTDGEVAYEFITGAETTPEQNEVVVKDNVNLRGGNGGNGGDGAKAVNASKGGNGATAIIGNNLTINNHGMIEGGKGGKGGFNISEVKGMKAGDGGDGAVAIIGDHLVITNNSIIRGGAGSNGAGQSGHGGNGGRGASAIVGDYLTIANDGTIEGGRGGSGGSGSESYDGGKSAEGATAIIGNYSTITNTGSIRGGAGGSGGRGDDGRASGGEMGYGGSGGDGSNGGFGINGDYLTIKNFSNIKGGDGGDGGRGGSGAIVNGNGGKAAHGSSGISGNHLKIINSGGYIEGGHGGSGGNSGVYNDDNGEVGGDSGSGGHAIVGNDITIINDSYIQGGNGGDGGNGIKGGRGSKGGDGANGNHLNITNSGFIEGGRGGRGGNDEGALDGVGGNGISGDYQTITNSGYIEGGKGGENKAGGDGIVGSNITIINSGKILAGPSGYSYSGTDESAAIRTTGGVNSLTLEVNSEIFGDVVLKGAIDPASGNTLAIVSNAETTIEGNLIAGSNTGVTLSGSKVTFTDDATFADNSSLTFDELGDGAALHANSISFDGTKIRGSSNIVHWKQSEYMLATTENGISGAYDDKIENALLTAGAKDYAGAILVNNDNDLAYGLKWNDFSNDAYGTFDLKQNATLTLGVALADNASVNTNNINGWDGKTLTKEGLGTLVLTEKNVYTGDTRINAGALKTGVEDAFAQTSGVRVQSGATLNLGGYSQNLGAGAALNNAGLVLINDWNADLLTNPVLIGADITNTGLVVLNNCAGCTGQVLNVAGNWSGGGGSVSFATVLGGDDSLTDKLTIAGDVTGKTYVKVNNVGGTGAKTNEGIELIKTGSSTQDAFILDGRLAAGSYEYILQQGTASGANLNNWYLVNATRPEIGGYANNLAAAATMFNMRLNDRQGKSYYTDRNGSQRQSNVWLRYEGIHSKNRMSDSELENTANRNVFQLGGDLLGGTFNDVDSWRLGVMGGYGKQKTTTHNSRSGYDSEAEVSGYSVGLYGTWHQNAQDRSGLYMDSWVLYNWFDNTVQGDQKQGEKYKSHGFSASLEGGYNFLAGSFTGLGGIENNFFLRPQGQVIWSGVRADKHTDIDGTDISGLGNNNVQTRLGLRMSLSPVDNQAPYNFEPFFEANWLHNTKLYGVEMGGDRSFVEGSKNLGEIKIGLEGRFNENLDAWASLAHLMGAGGYRDTKGIFGMKYRF